MLRQVIACILLVFLVCSNLSISGENEYRNNPPDQPDIPLGPTTGYRDISYNSCRNRHCPKCGQTKQLQWADKLASSLMPVRYFHIIFTLPHELAEIVLTNQQECYNILFKTSVESCSNCVSTIFRKSIISH